jgi:hypothetical protein
MGRKTLTSLGGLLALLCASWTSAGAAPAGELTLNAALPVRGETVSCPPPASIDMLCHRTESQGLFPGLGRVSYPSFVVADTTPVAGCGSPGALVRGYDVRLMVAGKGTIDVAIADGTECVFAGTYSRPFEVTGGTGVYAQVSGRGTFTRRALPPHQNDTWSGTLAVPALEFDLTAPTIHGATSKAATAPKGAIRARVRYAVTAQDAVDGSVPVACTPRSGSLFKVGRTKVTCSATDTSGNTQSASFTVRVVRKR